MFFLARVTGMVPAPTLITGKLVIKAQAAEILILSDSAIYCIYVQHQVHEK